MWVNLRPSETRPTLLLWQVWRQSEDGEIQGEGTQVRVARWEADCDYQDGEMKYTADNWRIKPNGRCRLSANFWDNTEKASDCECILWIRGTQGSGYGSFPEASRKFSLAHRRAYEINNAPIPDHLFVLHSCDNPRCVNPKHLRLGTHLDNVKDMISKSRNPYFGQKGEKHPKAKLNRNQVDEILSKYQLGNTTQKALAEEYRISFQHVSELVKGHHWI